MTRSNDCACLSGNARSTQFRDWRSLPTDMTEGRYGDVNVWECVECGRLWLSYRVEYEAFSTSGRWARGLIDTETAKSIEPEEATDFLAALPSYIRGGSRFDGKAKEISGHMHWGI